MYSIHRSVIHNDVDTLNEDHYNHILKNLAYVYEYQKYYPGTL